MPMFSTALTDKKEVKTSEIKQQQPIRKISGIVSDQMGPLIGVTISVKGSTIGTISDQDGKFSIEVPTGSTLDFSYVGFKSHSIVIHEQTTLEIIMEENSTILDDIIVVGYGSQKKSDITGAMVNVKSDAIAQAPVPNIASALQGLAAGVDVQLSGGNTHPGAVPQIRIRGERSLGATNDALIVVDGIPFSGSLNDISNDDILSVSILKDASATAIYGSRGANGVLLITTKRGEKNKLNINYNGYYGVTTALKYYNLMDSDEYMRLKQWAVYNNDPSSYTGPDDPKMMVIGRLFRDQEEMDGYYDGNDTDWQDLIFKNGITTNHQVSISGGGEKTTYNASLGYYKGQNNYRGHDFDRMTAKLSIDTEITKFLRVGISSLNTYTLNKGQDVNPMDQALRASPFTTPYEDDGTLRTFLPGSGQNVWNPLLDEEDGAVVDNRKSLSTFTTGYAEVKFPLGFKYRFNGGINLKNSNVGKYQQTYTTKRMGGLNWAYNESRFTQDYTLENILTWDKTFFNDHNIGFTGLYSYQEKTEEMNNINSNDYFDDNIQYYNPSKAASGVKGDGSYSKWAIISYMARLNYNYKEKYLLTATIRHDGSSRLAKGNKWHSFPSIALGWNIIRESFMQNIPTISGLKLRASWGNVGSTAINPYQTISKLSDNKYLLGTNGVIGVYPGTVPDVSLGWENTESINFGLDFGLLNNRISGTLEVYQQKTTDLLLPVNLPPTSGYYSSYTTNLGKTRNRGIEFNVSTINIDGDGKNKFSWTTDFNIFTNRNKILDLGPGVERMLDNGWFKGEDKGIIYSLEHDGLWQDTPEDRELAKNFGYNFDQVVGTIKVKNHHIDYEQQKDSQGNLVYDENGNPVMVASATQKINDDDRVFIGRRTPDFEGGLNNRIAWKGFDFSALFTFRYGGTLTSDMHNGWMNTMQGGYNNIKIDYWTPDNTEARWPKPSTGTVSNKGLLARYDASYLKLRNITLGYTIPKSMLAKFSIQSARVYATASNIYTWFDSTYKKDGGIDPETTSTISLTTPPVRTFLFGVNLAF